MAGGLHAERKEVSGPAREGLLVGVGPQLSNAFRHRAVRRQEVRPLGSTSPLVLFHFQLPLPLLQDVQREGRRRREPALRRLGVMSM